VAGKGTEEFSTLKKGDTLQVLGPLGNGFPLEKKKAILIGGGIGIPPMLELAKQLDCEKSIVLGYRDVTFMNDNFQPYGEVYLSTEDGSYGVKGNVIDAIRRYGLKADVIYACGPTPMLKGVKAYAEEQGIECYLSLEERMACGIGACLACVCKTKEKDHHTNVQNTRICKEGPVFASSEIEL
jgi:dihydroorotate dehydrogenase electron transfer subunit